MIIIKLNNKVDIKHNINNDICIVPSPQIDPEYMKVGEVKNLTILFSQKVFSSHQACD
jgi:hypothetical protein